MIPFWACLAQILRLLDSGRSERCGAEIVLYTIRQAPWLVKCGEAIQYHER
jgi:hypothetical protein